MSSVELLGVLKKLKGVFQSDIKITINGREYLMFNPRIDLEWTAEGYLSNVKITGVDQNGETRTFKKTLSWSPEGYLQSVSGWEEV